MTSTIAFVGAGPTTIYTLHALIEAARQPLSLTIFEQQPSAGRGTPYRPGWNDPAMLSNIASIEIPPLIETLVDWLRAQPADRLAKLGVDPADIGERVFYPRLALGDYLHDQFQALLERARVQGHEVDVRIRTRVLDALSQPDGMILSVRARGGAKTQEKFDHVVLATGHQWPDEPEVRPGYFLSPWPASALATIRPSAVGIRGTSLSAIDASVALALRYGTFDAEEDGRLRYEPAAGADGFRMTMMSRKGLLPEADFFHPIPYEPLTICTADAIEAIIADDDVKPLDAAFALFKRELAAADPDYAAEIELEGLSLEEFSDRYFAERGDLDPFDWAEWNLTEAKHNHAARITVPWRYAILRMHETLGNLVPHLDQEDYRRFSQFLKPVFVDDYATVPHESIERMLALHRAGKLDILAIGDDHRVDSHREEGGAVVHIGDKRLTFPAFIEATGQRPLGTKDFPFQSLLDQGIVRDAPTTDPREASRGIVIDDQFHPVSDAIPDDQLFCLSLPFLLGRHPFSQGITSSHEMGKVVGEQVALAVAQVAEMRANPAVEAA
ncbi:FAD/NAD(P)-binding protein [Sphingomonas sp. CGMCC 1.13654]|uniref:FAD/NAD(P)-binding protein n=2 Tax=Sphingomonas chungangi TaxID=2683589 RepID=A0A838LDD0_9SPHN|nr:FAD/NAD(P)-binding protein [Sphingomonas chungangi]MVW56054.1 FAD-dependent oxidoreductase [Sphingomonas chungangi]